MKNFTRGLIAVAAISTLLAVISRVTLKPISGIEARAMACFAGLLLLFAISLEGLK